MKKPFLSFLTILVILMNMFAVFTSAADGTTQTYSVGVVANGGTSEPSGSAAADGAEFKFSTVKAKSTNTAYFMANWTPAGDTANYKAMLASGEQLTREDGGYINQYSAYLVRSASETEGTILEAASSASANSVPFTAADVDGLCISKAYKISKFFTDEEEPIEPVVRAERNLSKIDIAVEIVEEATDSIPAGALKILFTYDVSEYSYGYYEIELTHIDGDKYTVYLCLGAKYQAEINYDAAVTGSGVATRLVAEGDTFVVPASLTRGLYTFDGWYTDAEFTKVWDANTTATGDITLYAKWDAPEYTVTFVDGGTTVNTITEEYDTTIDELPTPTKDGGIFAGWYTDEALTIPWNEIDVVTGDMTLYAAWEFTVVFENEDGSIISSEIYRYGDEVIPPPNTPKKADDTHTYTFAGWDKEVTACTGNATYTATYTAEILGSTVAAIVGIAAAVVVVLGLGGFFIFRFVGKKKK